MLTASLEGPFFYPNRVGRIIPASMNKELGGDSPAEVLRVAGQSQLANTGALPANLDKRFPFRPINGLQAATEQLFGVRAGRNRTTAHRARDLRAGAEPFQPILGIADMPMRLIPFGMNFHVRLDVFARVFTQFSDQIVKLSETDTHHLCISRAALCAGSAGPTTRAASSPARYERASFSASRRSVLTRSPGRTGVSAGATTAHFFPIAAVCRWTW